MYSYEIYLIVWTNDGLISGLNKISDAIDGRAVEVAAILAVLNELSGLDVQLHLFSVLEEVVLAMDLSWTTWS
jgi:hypothetical protein